MNLSPSSSAIPGPTSTEPETLKMKAPRSFETSGTTYSSIHRQIPKEWNAYFLHWRIKNAITLGKKKTLNVVTFMCVNMRVWTWSCIKGRHRLKVFLNKVLRNTSGWENEASEKCIAKRFKTPALQILLGWLNQRRSTWWGLWHDWEKRQVNTGF
jgi:hypothetical protein